MADRFDLEEAIYKVWQTSDDLELIVNAIYDGPKPMTEDEIFNTVYGLKKIHDIKMQHLFNVFEQVFELNQYAPDDVKELREEVLSSLFNEKVVKKKGKKK